MWWREILCVEKENINEMTKAVNVLVGILIIYILNQSQWIFIKDDKTISNSFPIPLVFDHAHFFGFPFPTV